MMSMNDGPYFHEGLVKSKAEDKLMQGEPTTGKFLIRSTSTTVALSVVYQGRPTHHKISSADDKTLTINATKTECTNLTELVEFLGQKHKFWPVPLKDGVPNGAPKKKTKKKTTNKRPWFHASINKTKAEELLNNLGLKDGNFLVRSHKDPSKFVMSVVFKGRPTHHLAQVTPDGILLNNAPLGNAKTMDELIPLLMREKVGGWPILLQEFPENKSKEKKQQAAPSDVPTMTHRNPNDASGGGGGGGGGCGGNPTRTRAWYHVGVNKTTAETLLATVGNEDGVFLIRSHKDPSKFVLSVMFQGNPTHHLGTETEGMVTINGKTIAGASSMDDLIPMLMTQTVKGWPCKLTRFPEAPLGPTSAQAQDTTSIKVEKQGVEHITTNNNNNNNTNTNTNANVTTSKEDPPIVGDDYLDVEPVSPRESDNDTTSVNSKSPANVGVNASTLSVTMMKTTAGYGMSLLNNGYGNFVTAVKEGGIAERVLNESNLRVDAGLRISAINGINMMDCPKLVCTTLIKEANQVDVLFMIDKQGYFDTLYKLEHPDVKAPVTAEPVTPQQAPPPRPRRHSPYDNIQVQEVERKVVVDQTLPVASAVSDGWEAETMFSSVATEVMLPYDANLFAESNVVGFVGPAAVDVCDQIMLNKTAGSYIIRVVEPTKKSKGGFEIIVQNLEGDEIRTRRVVIEERDDGRLEALQRLYYRLQDVMKDLVRKPFWIKTNQKKKVEIKLEIPISPQRAAPTTAATKTEIITNPTFDVDQRL